MSEAAKGASKMKSEISMSLLVVLGLSLAPAAHAGIIDSSNVSIKTGFGDEITIKKGIFGNKKKVVKDRLGDKYEVSNGIFGNTNTEINLLGNSYSKKKGILGTRETEMKSLLGDSFKTKKSWLLGRRTTTIDASGVTGLVGSAISRATRKPMLPPMPVGNGAPDVSTFGSRMAGDMGGGENLPPPMSAMPESDLSAPPAGELDTVPFSQSPMR